MHRVLTNYLQGLPGHAVQGLCSCLVALVYRVITGITSSLLAMGDVQPWVRCAVALSGLHCVITHVPFHQED
jgi:hypothetical protein